MWDVGELRVYTEIGRKLGDVDGCCVEVMVKPIEQPPLGRPTQLDPIDSKALASVEYRVARNLPKESWLPVTPS